MQMNQSVPVTEPERLTQPPTAANHTFWPVAMLLHRAILFLVFQALLAGAMWVAGAAHPWATSAAWWPATAVMTNLISFGLIRWQAGQEGLRWSQLIGADFRREVVGKDLLALLGFLVLSVPAALIPDRVLATLLFGDPMVPVSMFTQPLTGGTIVIVLSLVLFPLTQGLAELPTYFGYAMPRLARTWASPWRALLAAAFWLGAQHLTLPLIADLRFVLWRLGMFLPFALLLGVALRWRPRLLPYFMVVHVLIDTPVAIMVWQASVG